MNNYNTFDEIKKIIKEKNDLKEKIKKFKKNNSFNKEYNDLYKKYYDINNIINIFNKIKKIEKEINSIKKIKNNNDILDLIKEELLILNNKKNVFEIEINKLINKLKDNKYIIGCFIEIISATGGIESSLFVNDLYKMYLKYSYKKNWNVKLISRISNSKGGYKSIILKIKNYLSYKNLKLESGGHRVQRIPKTESQGRTHTSTCIVAVIPMIEEKKFKNIKSNDLRIDTFKSSGAGGQHVNTTDSAIRITHIPTGTIVECQDERSQHKNKSKAMSILQSRLYLLEKKKTKQEKNIIRKNLLGTGYRSDRIRTYNFIQNRITDHRFSFNLYKLNDVLNGDLDLLINNIKNKDL